jgi:uncharacterized protein
MSDLLFSGPRDGRVLLLAHGAGAPMDSDWLNDMAGRLAELGVGTARFEFAYMAARRSGQRKPPPKAEKLVDEFRIAVAALGSRRPIAIGGKSMGGRVASLIADELFASGQIDRLVCLGYPFHPPGSPEKLRTAHLLGMRTPTLICHGERDPFGSRAEVETYPLSDAIALEWLPDGDHDLRPRKALTGLTLADNLATAATRIASFLA